MIERLEELLEQSIICNIAKGISIAVGITFAIVAFAAGICTMILSPWWAWLLFFIFSGVVTGIAFGFAGYLFEEY